ncbi:2-keto-3-deoxygluconate permease [Paucilactobacillus hokkaidonensis JCM 18461]|uniref:2-keto-3-deoxygluconate permease n=3 Tax=Paucilactobacillus hokkaidonensis TaxID=1193095 RepID=A0A0A1H002_9LACO|nr:2-keto-3-deoxygluconate permease [Paucilactobacillus hokkaidonensis]KRO08884.1 2-keto-3-deoxygluconate permease [Paucilactobacillus hokkaidonensis]BAP86583.1 2-keto-3-deoxygluconate permease [Paucilactobacillus hokkaidonensis JCM 18461]
MEIKKNIEKIPGGMMVVPLVLGAIIHSIWPKADVLLTGVTGSYMVGTSVILFIFFFAVGTNINLKSSGKIAAKGLNLLFGKVILAAIIAIVMNMFLPKEGITTGVFSGLSVLAVLASFNASNGGLYVALMTTIPDREVDVAAYPFFSIQSGPFFTMVTLGLAGIGAFPWPALVSTLVPFVLGMVIGGLDPEMKKMFSPLQGALVPFFAFTIGYSLSLEMILKSGLMGILIGVLVVFVSGYVLYLLDKYLVRSDGLAGWAASSTAGAAVSVPIVIAQMDPNFKSTAESATAIVATSVLVTAILTPIVTMWFYKRMNKKNGTVTQTK